MRGHPTDVRVVASQVDFRDVTLEHPLALSSGVVRGFTLAVVQVQVANRRGGTATGMGATILAVAWAWPRSICTPVERDHVMRQTVIEIADFATHLPPGDPFQLWHSMESALDCLTAEVVKRDGLAEPVPALAATLALGAVDTAIHDAWGNAAGMPTWDMYDPAHLVTDLSAYLGPDFAGRYPGEDLTPPSGRLNVQHVLGVDEPLTSLREWVRRDRIRHVKIKLSGADLREQVARIVAVHGVLAESHDSGTTISLDANEAFSDPNHLVEPLDRLRRDHPGVWTTLTYLEQPIPREATGHSLPALASLLPVMADESLARVSDLTRLTDSGWTGFAVKAARGQSMSLLTTCWGRRRGVFLGMQDLTAVDLALVHSACLATRLPLSQDTFEYNSRQYAPRANDALAAADPALVAVEDGMIRCGPGSGTGLYWGLRG